MPEYQRFWVVLDCFWEFSMDHFEYDSKLPTYALDVMQHVNNNIYSVKRTILFVRGVLVLTVTV